MTSLIIKELREAGLKQNEAEIYVFLLQNGVSTPPVIAKGTGIARTNCYNILKHLKERDVVEEEKKGKRAAFIARDPESLKLSLERQLENVTRLLPDLRASYIIQKNKPLFRFYDGWREVQKIYDQTLVADEIYATGSTDRLMELDAKFFEKYVAKVKELNIAFYDLLPADSKESPAIIERNPLHSIKFLPNSTKENLTDILIWNDNVALIALEEPIFGTVITSHPLAETMRMILKVAREGL